MSYNYSTVAGYLSSSEINRCKKNGLDWYNSRSVKEWHSVFAADWLPRKLRRKLRQLYHLDLLPVKIAKYIMPIMTNEEQRIMDGFRADLAKAFMKAEDDVIMKGI